jgi:hypothetical protein
MANQNDVLAFVDAGITNSNLIADRLNCLPAYVRKTIQRKRPHLIGKIGRPSEIDHARCHELYSAGCNDPEIARQLGVQPATIWKWRKKNGLPVA